MSTQFPLSVTDEDMLTHIKEWEIAGYPVMMKKNNPLAGWVELRNPSTIRLMEHIEVGKYPPKAKYERSGEHWMLVYQK
jgi:hypothetical protein